ncbi:MAG: ATP-dependent helicase [Bacilli bacterium]
MKKATLDLNFLNYAIMVDVSKEVFLQNIIFLFNNLLYPLYLYEKNYKVNGTSLRTDKLSISPLFIHNNQEAVELHLYLEAWNILVARDIKKLVKLANPYKLDELNAEQLLSVKQINGPVCLLAGAGSGKTKTLVNRILELLNKGVKQSSILVLAFNNKAAKEIKNRMGSVITDDSTNIMTFHAFGNRLLHQETTLEFYSEDTKEMTKALLEQAVSKYQSIIFKDGVDPLSIYLKMLSNVKNNLINVNNMMIEVNHEIVDFFPIFKEYLRLLEEEHFYDYDDMIYLSIYILLKNGSLRRLIQEQYKYILVDEFQDLNPAQLLLLKIISLPQNNLFVVGDDDQMIYAFRGASIDHILNFNKEYPYAKQFCLTTNYRSKEKIVTYAKQFIDCNLKRVSKNIKASTLERGEVVVKLESNFLNEFTSVLNWLDSLDKTCSVAIIYRYNIYGLFLTSLLEVNGIIRTKSNPQLILKNQGILKLYLDYLFGHISKSDLSNICSIWGFSNINICSINKLDNYLEINKPEFYKRLIKVKNMLAKGDLSLRVFMTILHLEASDLFKTNNEEMTNGEIGSLLASFIDYFGGIKHFYYYQKTVKAVSTERDITIQTIHKTKGNEFDAVCYFHMATPQLKEELETERRISYVALTRAKSNILITSSNQEQLTFLKEYLLNPELSHLNKQELLERNQLMVEQKYILNKQLLLLNKDIFLIKNKCDNLNKAPTFEVAEASNLGSFYSTINKYYKLEKEKLDDLRVIVSELEHANNNITDEISNRNLF